MKKILTILSVTVMLYGCSGTIGNKNMPTSKSSAERQMTGMTTKAEVRKELGTPNLVFEKNGMEAYEYKSISGAGRYHWLIPITGYIMSFWQDDYTYTETNLFIFFDKSDKVKDWELLRTGGTTN
ncbi:hypothetical protein FACS18945_4840 [Bacteroidia bacterium]|nr:hypothetical protein FACS18945_4840 [Bacteroidia bacterium]